MAREALEAMKADVCPTAVSASISYPYAYAEALTPQEREPEGRARAELAEVWGWLQRIGLVTMTYDKVASRSIGHTAAVPRGILTAGPDDNVAIRTEGQKAKRPRGKETLA
jgi:chromosome partitioning protein